MDFYSVAEKAAREAGEKLLELLKGEIKFTYKDSIDIQAEGDLISEKIIIDHIRKHFPEHSILSEESGEESFESEYLWVIDPIDGTMNFSRRRDDFVVSIALVKNKDPILGIVYQPTLDRLYSAKKGEGALLNGEPIHVSEVSKLDKMILDGNDPAHVELRQKSIELMGKVQHQFRSTRLTHGAAIRLCELASGKTDVSYSNGSIKYWDIAASLVILEEAGGRITGFDGSPVTSETSIYIASNNQAHDKLVQLLNSN